MLSTLKSKDIINKDRSQDDSNIRTSSQSFKAIIIITKIRTVGKNMLKMNEHRTFQRNRNYTKVLNGNSKNKKYNI